MTIRKSYYESLWSSISDVMESDKKEIIDRATEHMIELALLSQESPQNVKRIRDISDQIVNLPTEITFERIKDAKERHKREFLSQDTRLKIAKKLELRRFYMTHVFMQKCMKTHDVSFSEFMNSVCGHFYKDSIEAGYNELAAKENSLTQTAYHYCLALFANHGRPTFVPSPGLTEALIHTEFRDVPSDLVQLPHPAIFIEAPPNSGLTVVNTESGSHELIGAFVVEYDNFNTDKQRTFQVLLVGKTKESSNQKVLFDDALFHFKLIFRPDSTVGDCLKLANDTVGSWLTQIPSPQIPSQNPSINPLDKWQTDVFPDCARFVLNTLLYITLPDAEIDSVFSDSEVSSLLSKLSKFPKGSKKREFINSQLKKKDQHKFNLLGSSVKITRFDPSDDSGNDSIKTESHRKINVAFIRRGHWRHQPFGPGRKQTRLLWIRPTMVNPQKEVMKVTTYKVE